MPDLFDAAVRKAVVISDCGLYRYRLERTWDDLVRPACFIGLNPSTADAEKDDATIRRMVGFAREWSCGGILVVNLFAYRATEPAAMRVAKGPVGPDNDRHIVGAVGECNIVVAAWGAHGGYLGRDREVLTLLRVAGLGWPQCLGTTKDGHPRHPLYLPTLTGLVPFPGRD